MNAAEVIKIQPRYLNLADASRYCGLAKRTLEDAAKAGKFRNFVQARRRLVDRASLDEWIEGGVLPFDGDGKPFEIPEDRATAKDIAKKYKLSESAVLKKAKAGHIPCIRIGKSVRFDMKAVVKAIEGQQTP